MHGSTIAIRPPDTAALPEPTTTVVIAPDTATVSPTGVLADRCSAGQVPTLVAYDVGSGDVRWLSCAEADVERAVIAVNDATVFAIERRANGADPTGGATRLIAFDPEDGSTRWDLDVSGFSVPAGPFDVSGVVVITAYESNGARSIVAVDSATGQIRWEAEASSADAIVQAEAIAVTESIVVVRSSGPPTGQDVSPGPPASPPPGVQPGVSRTVTFYSALDRSSGAPSWSARVATPADAGPSFGHAVVDGDRVIVTPGPVALDATTGAELWRNDENLGDAVPGAVSDGVLLVGGQDDPTTALDAATGELLWTQKGSTAYDDVWAVGDGGVFVVDTAAAELVAYGLIDGTERWRRPFERYSWPWHVSGGVLYAMWTNLDAIDTSNGSTVWATNYPSAEFPRMTGAGSNAAIAVVSLSSAPLAGD
jgi:outer membrane protein assembly factor BamB